MSAEHSRGHVSPVIYLSACMSTSQSDISISQQWVPETLKHLFLHPANQGEGKKSRREEDERRQQ